MQPIIQDVSSVDVHDSSNNEDILGYNISEVIENMDIEGSMEDIIPVQNIGTATTVSESNTMQNLPGPSKKNIITNLKSTKSPKTRMSSKILNSKNLKQNIAKQKTTKDPNKLLPPGFTPKTNIKWLHSSDIEPTQGPWNEPDMSNVLAPNEPIEYFRQYFTNDIFSKMVDMTNLYALQNNDISFKPTNQKEVEIFIGLHIATGVLKFPRIHMYWNASLGIGLFQNSMTKNRFFKLRNNLHVVNNLELDKNNCDKFKKVRPIIDCVLSKVQSLKPEEKMCIDEQIIPFKGHHGAKTYNPKKPNPWGLKVFVLCGESGIVYDLIMYQGKSTEFDRENLQTFGLGPSIVLHLSRNCKPQTKLYFDNFFASYHLFQALKMKGILAASTARVDRFASPPFIALGELKKKGRGAMQEVVSKEKDVILVRWLDNKPVTMASNFVGIGNITEATRWDKEEKCYLQVSRPEVITLYNSSMGGVDKIDFLLALYRTFIRSRKWTLRVIFHFVDIAVCNSWLEYKRDCKLCGVRDKNVMDLLNFRMAIAYGLARAGVSSTSRKRGRPSTEEVAATMPTRFEQRPPSTVRYDTIDHLPVHSHKDQAGRCKMRDCKGKSRIRCEKCNIYLCLTKDRNCFRAYHIQ